MAVQGAVSDPKVAGSLLDYKDGKVNGIPVWVWIVVPLLAVLLLLIVAGACVHPSHTVQSVMQYNCQLCASRNLCMHVADHPPILSHRLLCVPVVEEVPG